MKVIPKAITQLIESFERLPGIGPKTAQRLVFYLLHVPENELEIFAQRLINLKKQTVLCGTCKNVAETSPCHICSDPARNNTVICVVEQPTDVLSIEKTKRYNGLYHVLHGVIDPLNNIGPDELYMSDLFKRVSESHFQVSEIILATNPNMEGEATAMYIKKVLRTYSNGKTITITRLAHGLPVGADLEYTDEITLWRALEGRRNF